MPNRYKREYETLRRQGWSADEIIDFLNRVAWQEIEAARLAEPIPRPTDGSRTAPTAT